MYTLQPEKKTRGYTKILAIVCGIALVIFGVAIFVFPLAMLAGRPIALTSRDVSYKIRLTAPNGCAEFSVTYTMPGGTQHKEVTACKGYTLVRKFIGSAGDSLSMTVQNRAAPGGLPAIRYDCIIDVDGNRIASTTSVASTNAASCSGTIP